MIQHLGQTQRYSSSDQPPASASSQTPESSASDSGHDEDQTSSTSNYSEQVDDCFVDAQDNIASTTRDLSLASGNLDGSSRAESKEVYSNCQDDSLQAHLEETREVLRLALSNEFARAMRICSQKHDLYSSLAHATLSFLRVALTLEPNDLQEALQSIQRSYDVSQGARRKSSTASMMMRFIYRPNYNTYSDEECHSELVHAESLLLLALISFLADQSLLCLVKGALRIRNCYQRYKECQYIMEHRTNWESDVAKRHFESGVTLGHGVFNVLMSYLPRRVLRFLEYVGFSGNQQVGVDQLDRSVELMDGLRSVFAGLTILAHQSYIDNLFGLGSYDSSKLQKLNDAFLGHYPNSAFFLLFRGRYHQMAGNITEALDSFETCIRVQDDWKQFHSICHWEIMWCYAVKQDWVKAAQYSDLLRKRSKWSVASYTYQYATFLYAQLMVDQRESRCNDEEFQKRMSEIEAIMRSVPELRVRLAGKTIPAEKFAITRSAKFLRQGNRLSLPALEFLYVWNIFTTLKNNPQQMELLLKDIECQMKIIEDKIAEEEETTAEASSSSDEEDEEDVDEGQSSNWNDDLCLVHLLKGMCLKQLKRSTEAEQEFHKILELEAHVVEDKFLIPHAIMEIALLKLDSKEYDECRKWTKRARNDYTGYLLETMVHFRLHAANRVARTEKQMLTQKELASSSESVAIDKSDS